jgi:Ca2+-binding EF-hand superfamily protein
MPTSRRLVTFLSMSLLVGPVSTAAFAAGKHAGIAAPSTASAAQSDVRQLLRLMDRDKNGAVSKDEFLQFMSRTFDRRDVNRSGLLESNELSTFSKRTAAVGQSDVRQLTRLMDRDKNGAVSKDEFLQYMSRTFDRLDVNKSGQLEPKELRQMTIPNWLIEFQGHTNQ